jgi:NAD(P)-dependent dehydrogenase (short-subunit alcohol dehydrogenase family)
MKGRVVLITGGAQGIGKAIGRRFLAEGARVALVDADAEAGEETREEFASLGEAAFVPGDVGVEATARRAVKTVLNLFGRLDVLVNNAGIGIGKPMTELTLREWNRVLAVNLTGAFLFSRQAASHLRKSRGAIINIASTRALMSEPNTEAYSASKGGIVALTHAMAVSLGPEVRVNCISPGWIEVAEWRKRRGRKKPALSRADHAQHPAGRVGTPEDIAALAAFLVSNEAGFITGANFIADGGMTRKMIYVE